MNFGWIKKKGFVLLLASIISMAVSGCSTTKNAISPMSIKEVNATPVKTEVAYKEETPKPEASVKENELVPFKGKVEHIFFHPLIIYPEKAFDNDSLSTGYNDWFVTVKEFDKILESLYEKNFVLVNYTQIYEEAVENSKTVIRNRELMLPSGKKPLIISIDDLNYYEYMRENGNAYKLVLDTDGKTTAYVKTPSGQELISRENEIIPILDEFVEKHSDFSHDGAKGIIALTGYEGVLGYCTNKLDSPDFEKEKKEALFVIDHLKKTGWTFACHGWGHLDAAQISTQRLIRDTKRWKSEVESLIGTTDIYIFPFGSTPPEKGESFKFLKEEGFKIFCSVGPVTNTIRYRDYVISDRRAIDGLSMHGNRKGLLDLFDSNEVIDSVRPAKF